MQKVSFEVRDGEFLPIIGLSGSGMSTLLRCISRAIDPTEGRVLWDDLDITVTKTKDLCLIHCQIGMIFQQFSLVKRSTVLTNVLSGRLGDANPWARLVHQFSG